jgi:murein DD-endopeptidase MepM/ murein hydrolase activator NlpD
MPYALRSKLFLFAIFFATFHQGSAQKIYPEDYFRSPLDFRLLLSGTFGELRANHFHSGIDIKTNGAEGASVYAVADGYVSRIKVSAFGYGNALYITHPNGYVSLYGHLRGYNKAIADYVKKAQYRQESFEIELFPAEGDLPVKKNEIIAYSGNSGSSGGPHLHYEIRDGASQKPINPLLFGIEVKDIYRPKITSIKIYPEDENSKVNGANKAVRYPVEGWGTEHRLANDPAIRLSGNISFAIQAYDQQNDTDNKNGPYAVTLFIDSAEVFHFQMETFGFDDTRYVNSLIDYEEYMRNNARLQRTRIDPGNGLGIYSQVRDNGIFSFDDALVHQVRYEVKDVMGNTASLSFKVKSEKSAVTNQSQVVDSKFHPPAGGPNFKYNTPNRFENESVIVDAPQGVFYDSFTFKYDTARRVPATFSPVQRIHNKYTPIHDYIKLSVKPQNLPEDLRDKALIVKISDDRKSSTSAGGTWENNGFVTTKIREFGDYSVSIDTVPPKIKAVQPELYTHLAGQKSVKLIISDNLSGIASYRGMLNGKWILMEYDGKNDMLIYNIDEHLPPGRSTFLLEVRDAKNNRAFFAATFIL